MRNYKKPIFWAVLLAVVLCVALIVFLTGDPAAPSSGETNAQTTAPTQTSTPTETTEPRLEEGPWPLEELALDVVDYDTPTGLEDFAVPGGSLVNQDGQVQILYLSEKDNFLVFRLEDAIYLYRLNRPALTYTIDLNKLHLADQWPQPDPEPVIEVSASGITMLISLYDEATDTRSQACSINLVNGNYVYKDYSPLPNVFDPTGWGLGFSGSTLGQLTCVYQEELMHMFPQEFQSKAWVSDSPYDSNGNGLLQYHEFPLPTGELFGLTGADADLYNAAAQGVIQESEYWQMSQEEDLEDSSLKLISLGVYGQYVDKNGNTCYVCRLERWFFYDLGLGLRDSGQYLYSSCGQGTMAVLLVLSPEGELVEFVDYPNGGDPHAFYDRICGPLTDLAEAMKQSEAEPRTLVGLRKNDLLYPYLDHYFPGWR